MDIRSMREELSEFGRGRRALRSLGVLAVVVLGGWQG